VWPQSSLSMIQPLQRSVSCELLTCRPERFQHVGYKVRTFAGFPNQKVPSWPTLGPTALDLLSFYHPVNGRRLHGPDHHSNTHQKKHTNRPPPRAPSRHCVESLAHPSRLGDGLPIAFLPDQMLSSHAFFFLVTEGHFSPPPTQRLQRSLLDLLFISSG